MEVVRAHQHDLAPPCGVSNMKPMSGTTIRWPLPKGEVRDIPDDARIHNSALKRMETDSTYRPGNLIIGGGGRGTRVAPPHYGTGKWLVLLEEGDPIGEVFVRDKAPASQPTK